jgi:hypothetical protein
MKSNLRLARRYAPNRNVAITIICCCLFLIHSGALMAANILDKVGNPTATPVVAFSMRQLSSAYTGYAIQVRRASDNTTQDIRFTPSGDLDTVSLKAFVGNGDGYVSIWYDQSGNGLNAVQPLTGRQPTIMIGGKINRDNGKPSVYTSGGTGYLYYGPITQLNGGMQVTRMEVARSRDGNFAIIEGLGTFQLDLQLFPDKVMVQFEDHNVTASGAVDSITSLMAINSVRNNGASKLYINTALKGTTTDGLEVLSSPDSGYIGVRFDYYLGNPGPGAFCEIILFNSVLSDADRQAINYNQNWYYSLGFEPCSSTQTSLSANGTTTRALYACMQDGTWAYYYDPAHPLKLLFGIAKDPAATGANATFAIDSIKLTATANPTTLCYFATSGTEGIFAPGRYWNVYSPKTLNSPVNVRFFYDPADTVAAFNAAQAFKNRTGALMMSNLQWFKTVGGPFVPDSLTATPKAGIKGQTITLPALYGTTNDGVKYAEFDGITSFSGGTGVYIVSNTLTTLPIIIGSFSGRRVSETTLLSWRTELEANSDRFEIERSADGKTWIKISQVAAAGNSNSTLFYRFTDTVSLYEGNDLFYRLKLVDKDGQNTWSNVVLIKSNDNTGNAPQLSSIFPNPFAGDIEITCTIPASGAVEVQLQDIAGATLVRRQYTAKKGVNVWRLTNLDQLARGTYILRVVQGAAAGIGKVIKQ